MTTYKPIAEGKAKLRIYLNEDTIQKQIQEGKNPIELDGKVLIAKSDDGKTHMIFHISYSKADGFMPVFFDMDSPKMEAPKA